MDAVMVVERWDNEGSGGCGGGNTMMGILRW